MPWISLRKPDGHPADPEFVPAVREADDCEPVMPASHQAGGHPTFSLSHPTVAQKVVAVHQGQLAQEELDGALAPALLRTLALRERAERRQVTPTFRCPSDGASYLLQQASDELLVAAASLTPLADVGGRHHLLAQADVFGVHLCWRVSGEQQTTTRLQNSNRTVRI